MFLIDIHVTHFIARFGELVLFKHILTFLGECISFALWEFCKMSWTKLKKFTTHTVSGHFQIKNVLMANWKLYMVFLKSMASGIFLKTSGMIHIDEYKRCWIM